MQFVFLSPKNETFEKKQKDTCKENPNEGGVTLPKTNVAPENRPYQKEIDLPSPIFAEGCVFQGLLGLFSWGKWWYPWDGTLAVQPSPKEPL